ncbi:MAG: tryptophan synthase subunit alpha [Deltaproteobacteria bacterium]|nr:MAG: tryptophan synthase subunit alpha [Deltaproteobacteria bacterium]
MGRIGECFTVLRKRGERALIPFVTAGDPDLETTESLVRAMLEAGADAIELGVPFSDPIGEGPTIQRASERALRGGVSLRRVLELLKRLRTDTERPLILMGYANPFLAMGERNFADAAAEVGADGVICPDLPPEEGEAFYAALSERGVDGVLLASPTTTDARLARLAERTRGFLYYVSLTGVTGAREALAGDVEARVRQVRAISDVPVCVGFGVSTPEHARAIGRYADGVVVGSAIVDRIAAAASPGEAVDAVSAFVAALKAPLRP